MRADAVQGPLGRAEPPLSPAVPPLWLLIVVSGLPMVSVNIFLPSLPGMIDYFATDVATLYSALSLYLVGLAVGQLAYGPLSDRYGRRPMLLVGLVIYCFGSAVCALAPDIPTFLSGRVLQALGGCAGLVLSRAMIRDVYGVARSASMLGYTVMGMVVLTGVAPTIGGMLDTAVSWRAVFGFLVLVGAITTAASWWRAAETLAPGSGHASGGELLTACRVLVTRRAYVRFTLVSSLVFASFYAFVAGSPMVVIGLWGYSPAAFGAWWVIASVAYFIGNFVAGRFSQRFGVERMLGFGMPFLVTGAVVLVGSLATGLVHPLLLFVPVGISFIGSGIVQPNAIAGAMEVDPGIAGAGAAILGSMQILLGVASISLVGALPADTPMSFASICAGSLLAAIAVDRLLR